MDHADCATRFGDIMEAVFRFHHESFACDLKCREHHIDLEATYRSPLLNHTAHPGLHAHLWLAIEPRHGRIYAMAEIRCSRAGRRCSHLAGQDVRKGVAAYVDQAARQLRTHLEKHGVDLAVDEANMPLWLGANGQQRIS